MVQNPHQPKSTTELHQQVAKLDLTDRMFVKNIGAELTSDIAVPHGTAVPIEGAQTGAIIGEPRSWLIIFTA